MPSFYAGREEGTEEAGVLDARGLKIGEGVLVLDDPVASRDGRSGNAEATREPVVKGADSVGTRSLKLSLPSVWSSGSA